MSDNQVLRAWEERVISQERGSRIVHYILKDSAGNSLLAVEGRERSINHMTYVISENYLRVFGSRSSVRAGAKWRARRDVVEWLRSAVSRGGPILANSANRSSPECQVSQQSNSRQSSVAEVEGSAPGKRTEQASKRIKSCKVDQTLERNGACRTNLVSDCQLVNCEPTCKRLKIKGPSAVNKLFVPEPKCQVFSKFNEKIELLSQDSGMQGCWLRCKILLASENHLKVQYQDVLKVDGPGKLEEWVPPPRVAAPDTLGVRCVGRLTVRPSPCESSSDITFEVGAAVDAWWCNGWWEGVVIGYDTPTKRNLQVYFPGENRFFTVARKNIRISRDWIYDKWVNIKAKSDILSFLSSIFSTAPNLRQLPIPGDANSYTAESNKVLSCQNPEGSEEAKWPIPKLSKSVEELNLKKRFIIKYNEEMYCKSSG